MCNARDLFCFRASVLLLILLTLSSELRPQAESSTKKQGLSAVTAALLSDPHLDPFRDPTKTKRLAAEPVSAWAGILAQPASADAKQQFANLQKTCSERLPDADVSLEMSAFDSAQAAKPAFVLIAGDMLVHAFACRYHALLDPSGTDTPGMADFAAKTVEFQLSELKRRFPQTPVHLALGNNDSDCEDYSLDEDSRFLSRLAPAIASGWAGVAAKERAAALQDFKRFGSYALPLPAPANTRLVVLDDLYLSSDYRGTCGKKTNPASGRALLAWVESQLAEAKRAHQSVWVLAHIPPEVNIYRTYQHPHDICHGEKPASFFATNALDDLLVRYADTVRIFVSGHTHVDEIHVLEGTRGDGLVPLKTIPSVSPISGNPPAYLVAKVDSQSATLLDYELHTASVSTGPAIRWTTAYSFQRQYHEPAFTASALSDMMQRWQAAPDASAAEMDAYATHMASGLKQLAFRVSFPQQLCAMRHSSDAGFVACACAAKSGLLPPTQDAK